MRRHIMLGAVTIAATALALLLILQTTRQTEPQRARICRGAADSDTRRRKAARRAGDCGRRESGAS